MILLDDVCATNHAVVDGIDEKLLQVNNPLQVHSGLGVEIEHAPCPKLWF